LTFVECTNFPNDVVEMALAYAVSDKTEDSLSTWRLFWAKGTVNGCLGRLLQGSNKWSSDAIAWHRLQGLKLPAPIASAVIADQRITHRPGDLGRSRPSGRCKEKWS
jgi:hypothetical protein